MLIKSLDLQNFRQYYGQQHISFTLDSDKNVTVITGVNTGGKTTIVQSFIWCLYGKENFDEGDELINVLKKDELSHSNPSSTAVVSVNINLIHEDKEYLISRKRIYKNFGMNQGVKEDNNKFDIYVIDEFGNSLPIESYKNNDVINSILPEDLSEYFFFWGERIENLGKKKNISDSVKKFMGLDALEKAKKYLNNAAKEFDISDSAGETDENYIKYNNLYNQAINNIEITSSKIEELEIQYKKYLKMYNEQKELLIKYDIEKISASQKDIEENNRIITNLKKSIEDNKKMFLDIFNDRSVAFYSQRLSNRVLKILDEKKDDIETYSNITTKTIEEIIKRHKCICGREFCDNDEVYNELMRITKLVPPNRIDGEIKGYRSYINALKKAADTYLVDLQTHLRNIRENEQMLVEFEEKNKINEALVSKYPEAKGIKDKEKMYFAKLQEITEEIGQSKTRLSMFNNEKAKYDALRQKYKKQRAQKSRMSKYYDYALEAVSKIDEEYADNVKAIQDDLQKHVSQYFNAMYSGKRTVEIQPDYSIKLYDEINGNRISTGTSPGLETVKNFAFVAGLVEMARNKKSGKNDFMTSEPYPLVLDAPFSQADENHVPAIGKLISQVAEQTILVVMQKDWSYAEKNVKDRVGAFYVLEKKSDHETFITKKEYK